MQEPKRDSHRTRQSRINYRVGNPKEASRHGRSTNSPQAFRTLQRTKDRVPEQWGCYAHRSPPDVSTPSTSRATRPSPEGNNLGLSRFPRWASFIPATLMGFRLQGLNPPGDRGASPRPVLPCRYVAHSDATTGFEGLIPPGSCDMTEATSRALLAFVPSEVLPPATVPSSFLVSSSHALRVTVQRSRTQSGPKPKTSSRPVGLQPGTPECRQRQAGFTASQDPKVQGASTDPFGVCHLFTIPQASRPRPTYK